MVLIHVTQQKEAIMEQRTKLDFSGQDFYVGLDIHKKNWTVSIFSKDFEHKTFSQDPNPDILAGYIHRKFPDGNYQRITC